MQDSSQTVTRQGIRPAVPWTALRQSQRACTRFASGSRTLPSCWPTGSRQGRRKSGTGSRGPSLPRRLTATTPAVRTQAVPTRAVRTQAVPTRAVRTQAVPTRAVRTQAVPTRAVRTQAVPTQAGPTSAAQTPAARSRTFRSQEVRSACRGVAEATAGRARTCAFRDQGTPEPTGEGRPRPVSSSSPLFFHSRDDRRTSCSALVAKDCCQSAVSCKRPATRNLTARHHCSGTAGRTRSPQIQRPQLLSAALNADSQPDWNLAGPGGAGFARSSAASAQRVTSAAPAEVTMASPSSSSCWRLSRPCP
jgi:hypothetical protein